MTVGLLIVTHDQIGEVLLHTATRMFNTQPLATAVLSVAIDTNPEYMLEQARSLVDTLNEGDGVLVFTDMYGSTPSNIAAGLLDPGRVHVIPGLNLPMLVRTFNYASLDLEKLTRKAISGGKEGIFCCAPTQQRTDHSHAES